MDGQFLSEAATALQIRPQYQNYIGGDWIPPSAGAHLPHIEPFRETQACLFARSNAVDMTFALGAAHSASKAWRASSRMSRRKVLHKITSVLEAEATSLAAISYQLLGGQPLSACEVEVAHAIGHFRYAGMAFSLQSEAFYRTPQNICVQFLPATSSVLIAAWAISQAIQRGESIVLKPDVMASIPVLALVESLAPYLPDGVVNVVTGYDQDLISAVLEGERPPSKPTLHLLPAETHAKPAQVFFADVCDEVDAFQMQAIEGFCAFLENQNTDGRAPARAFIHKDIYDRFLARSFAHLSRNSHGTPLPSWAQYERTLAYIQIARNEGATLKYGGRSGGENGTGYVVLPTVFEGDNSMRIFRESVGGPVACVAPFENLAEVVDFVDDTPCPTSVGLWSRNNQAATCFKTLSNTPTIFANSFYSHPDHPAFVGYSEASLGTGCRQDMRYLARHLRMVG